MNKWNDVKDIYVHIYAYFEYSKAKYCNDKSFLTAYRNQDEFKRKKRINFQELKIAFLSKWDKKRWTVIHLTNKQFACSGYINLLIQINWIGM